MPLSEGLVLMRNALVGAGLKDEDPAGRQRQGLFRHGAGRNMAQGADWCNAARAFMFSVGCIQAQRCHLGTCPTGVTTQDPLRQRGLVPEVQGERAARFHAKTLEALADMVAAAGLKHPADLQPHHLMHRVGPEKAVTMDRIHTFLPEGMLLDAPEDTIYADWWAAAQRRQLPPRPSTSCERARQHATRRRPAV